MKPMTASITQFSLTVRVIRSPATVIHSAGAALSPKSQLLSFARSKALLGGQMGTNGTKLTKIGKLNMGYILTSF